MKKYYLFLFIISLSLTAVYPQTDSAKTAWLSEIKKSLAVNEQQSPKFDSIFFAASKKIVAIKKNSALPEEEIKKQIDAVIDSVHITVKNIFTWPQKTKYGRFKDDIIKELENITEALPPHIKIAE